MGQGTTGGDRLRADDPVRLLDDADVDPWIATLLQAREPNKVPAGVKQRVRLSLGSHARHAPLFLRPAVALVVLVGFGAFASAALGPWKGWIGRTYHRLIPAQRTAVAVAEPAERAPTRHAPAPAPAASVAPALEPPPPIASVPITPAARPAARPPVAARPHHLAPPPAATPEETQAVLQGMRALRVDRDPVRARALLAAYLDRNPNGALAEEALVLSIEAAVAHHDADAQALGARYLRRYPGGPFRTLALETQR